MGREELHQGPGRDGREKRIVSPAREWVPGVGTGATHIRVPAGVSLEPRFQSLGPEATGLATTKGSHLRLRIVSLGPREAAQCSTEELTCT